MYKTDIGNKLASTAQKIRNNTKCLLWIEMQEVKDKKPTVYSTHRLAAHLVESSLEDYTTADN